MATARVRPGDILGGKYRVERLLGAGGMGVVVAAKHIELGQRVALKFMLEENARDPEQAERFLREARAAVQLRSVHTARVLDVGRLGDGEPYMVMEYLEGRDLDAELRAGGPMPVRVAVEYILQSAEALAEAHGLGMIHRDVKLKNMFLTRGVDGRPVVKVLDFGLAKLRRGDYDVSLTTDDSTFGSPQYMSPEQMRSAKDVDTRTDLWSIGVCLYELLTGQLPFDAPTVPEICAMVLKDAPPRLSAMVPGTPPALEAVILRCLEKDVSRRFQSVAELGFALEPFAPEHGSARRILHVMRTAQGSEPSMTRTAVAHEAGRGTLNAWDSTGSPTLRKPSAYQGNTAVKVALGAVILLLTILSSILLWALWKPKAPPTSAQGTIVTAPSSMPDVVATAAPSDADAPTVASGAADTGGEEASEAPDASDPIASTQPPRKPAPLRPSSSARPKPTPSATPSAGKKRTDADHL
jgi:serine/threonine-protein kinase